MKHVPETCGGVVTYPLEVFRRLWTEELRWEPPPWLPRWTAAGVEKEPPSPAKPRFPRQPGKTAQSRRALSTTADARHAGGVGLAGDRLGRQEARPAPARRGEPVEAQMQPVAAQQQGLEKVARQQAWRQQAGQERQEQGQEAGELVQRLAELARRL